MPKNLGLYNNDLSVPRKKDVDTCYSPDNAPPYPVTSVNTKTGDIKLTASDVDAVATSDITQTLGTSTTKIPSEKAVSDAITTAGQGNMLKSIYDSNSAVANAGGIAAYVEANGGKINAIQVNGVEQEITNKTVNITVPKIYLKTWTA